ncbi:MAG: aminotransferase class I/II-fold pyridoxal phosphate-dependent enzyme [Chloroflexaceae bacterium]|nr:aminotransferase class I/II-fold pyridoxal phosphate-dependent enzyme [Chloroflexaceae bacterium]
MLTAEEFQRIYQLADSVGAYVLSDEAYRWLEVPGGTPFAPPMYNMGPLGLSVGTLSKPFGLPGLRIGWIAGPAELVQACWGMRDYVTLSPGKINDALAVLALKHRERVFERNRAIIAANLECATRWIEQHSTVVSWLPPRGGLLALLRYSFAMPSYELANRLAEQYSVMLAPGAAFGFENYLRIGIGQEPAIFAEGLARTSQCFADLEVGSPGD